MDEADDFFGTSMFVGGRRRGGVGGCGGHGGFVVEGVEVAAGFLELGDPSFGLEFVKGGRFRLVGEVGLGGRHY